MNRESSWQECLETYASLKITPDKEKAKALSEISGGRVLFLKGLSLEESNANYVFEAYYASLLELLHALVLLEGYKVSNHLKEEEEEEVDVNCLSCYFMFNSSH